MRLLLIIIVILLLVGALPTWPYSSQAKYQVEELASF